MENIELIVKLIDKKIELNSTRELLLKKYIEKDIAEIMQKLLPTPAANESEKSV